jgi:predicted nucleic acid-binding protein
MQPKAYIETSVISYLTARPSRDALASGHQELTRQWWEHRRSRFELYVSELVVQEAGRGDPAGFNPET